jgi:isopentenyl-diphosphate delta-isomerase
VIIKETGCGFSEKTLAKLRQCKVAAVDMSGLGGTHWGRIEGGRTNSDMLQQTSDSFKSWGISTLQSLVNAKNSNADYEFWASGGIRNGLDAAKYLALGANRIGIAKPMLEAALQGIDKVISTMQTFEYELKTALFCTGSKTINALRESGKWQLRI